MLLRETGSSLVETEVDGDGGCDIDRLTVEQIGFVSLRGDGVDCRGAEPGVSLNHMDMGDCAAFRDDRLRNDGSLDSLELGGMGVDRSCGEDEILFHSGRLDSKGGHALEGEGVAIGAWGRLIWDWGRGSAR